jgi:hypothetical protein
MSTAGWVEKTFTGWAVLFEKKTLRKKLLNRAEENEN